MVPHGVPLRKAEEAMATLFYKTSRSYKPQGQTPQGHTSELHDSTFQLLLEVEARRSKRLEVSLGYRETLSQSKQESKQTNSKEKKKKRIRRKKESTSLNSKICGECISIDERAAQSILKLQLSLCSLALAVWATHQHLRHWKVVYESQQTVWDESSTDYS